MTQKVGEYCLVSLLQGQTNPAKEDGQIPRSRKEAEVSEEGVPGKEGKPPIQSPSEEASRGRNMCVL